ncbi:MAG TPA: phosphoribosylamine--glycine ligase [Candidatus Krumholzibacteria bacterium]
MAATVLIIGSGGREHALAWKLAQSSHVGRIIVCPGNDGMGDVARCVAAHDIDAWCRAAHDNAVDLVVIGPEKPLVEGAADRLRAEGFAVFGVSAEAARLEGDKAYAKDFLEEFRIPAAKSRCFDDARLACAYLDEHPGPWVVKATGLAAGKGVSVCDDEAQAKIEVRRMLDDRAFGEAGARVLIEERLTGPELSVFAILDGKRMASFAPSRDHKRLLAGDRGPNTGGMGAYTPVADADAAMMERIDREILRPTLDGLSARAINFRGLLFVGLMLTADGPKVLEYNCRFGDPETQVVLPACDDDLFVLLDGAAHGELPVEGRLELSRPAVGIVLAAEGYPVAPRKGDGIDGIDEFPRDGLLFHAGTKRADQRWQTDGGRVLCAVAHGDDVGSARRRAVELAASIHFAGAQRRDDIALQEENAS